MTLEGAMCMTGTRLALSNSNGYQPQLPGSRPQECVLSGSAVSCR